MAILHYPCSSNFLSGTFGMTNNRKWIYDTLEHVESDDVPYNFMFSPPSFNKLRDHYKFSSVEDFFDFPIRMAGPKSIKPLYASPDDYGKIITDEFGVGWSTSYIDRGSPHIPVLPEASLQNYSFPNPSDKYRFEGLEKWCNDNQENFTMIWVGDLWERATFMRGMDKILLDISLHPEFVHELLENLSAHIITTMQILFDSCQFDCIALSDDYGTQNGMLMSPDHWREFIKPHLKKIYSLARDHNRKIFHHSCGDVYEIIPDFIELGLDILHPIQPEAMDIRKLKSEFGDQLTFCGGIPTQSLLPNGTPDEVRNEIRNLKNIMGKGGGYILEPGITLQADVPLANMIAMIEEATAR